MTRKPLLWVALGLLMSLALVAAVAAQEATPEAPAAPQAQLTERPVIGISVSDADGVVTVEAVAAGSGAEAAGLEVGDVITAINGDEVTSGRALAATVSGLAVGDTVTLTVERDGESQDIEVTLGAASSITMQPGREPRMFMQRLGDVGLSYDPNSGTWTITELSEDSPLYAAGLRADDVITAVDGEALAPMKLFEYLAGLGGDSTVTLTVERNGEPQDIEISAADLASLGMGMMFEGMPGAVIPGRRGQQDNRGQGMPNMPMMPGGMMMMGGNGRLGITFVTLDEQVASERGVDQTEGALVVSVIAGSPAAEAGLLENDVITAVNGEPVDEERTLRDRLIAYEPGDTVTLDVIRDGATQQIEVTLGQPEMGEFMPFGGFHFDPSNPEGMFRFFNPDNLLPPGHPPIDGSGDSNTTARPNV